MADLETEREKVQERLRVFASVLTEEILQSKNWGFALLLFEFDPGTDGLRNLQYISNAQRRYMIKALREEADRLEHGFAGDKNDPRDDPDSHLPPGG